MIDQFFAHELQQSEAKIPEYLIESTAPINIDDHKRPTPLNNTTPRTENQAIERIARALAERYDASKPDDPTLVISVHGFNCPSEYILNRYVSSFNLLNHDSAISSGKLVCIDYHWPSEGLSIKNILPSAASAAPNVLLVLFWLGLSVFIFPWLIHSMPSHLYTINEYTEHTLIGFISAFGALVFMIPVSLFSLRAAVYFRDGYRATSFGVHELVYLILRIEEETKKIKPELRRHGRNENPIQLSFIGHSMGSYVVTDALRILSDHFKSNTNEANIGEVFRLKRLVLVAPDIPAEALLSIRSNYRSKSLSRFEELFLFSNRGDEVLRQISRIGNYFSFPSRKRVFGYRLGNVGINNGKDKYGIVLGVSAKDLRIGGQTFQTFSENISKNISNEIRSKQDEPELLNKFSYFDCTDCVDNPEGKAKCKDFVGILTQAKRCRENNIGSFDHLKLLIHSFRHSTTTSIPMAMLDIFTRLSCGNLSTA